jgi:hypothetical protein
MDFLPNIIIAVVLPSYRSPAATNDELTHIPKQIRLISQIPSYAQHQ